MPTLTKRAERDLGDLPQVLQEKARKLIDRLDAEPSLGKKLKGKLSGRRSVWLGRTHRIVYTSEPTLVVLTVVQRKDAYR